MSPILDITQHRLSRAVCVQENNFHSNNIHEQLMFKSKMDLQSNCCRLFTILLPGKLLLHIITIHKCK